MGDDTHPRRHTHTYTHTTQTQIQAKHTLRVPAGSIMALFLATPKGGLLAPLVSFNGTERFCCAWCKCKDEERESAE